MLFFNSYCTYGQNTPHFFYHIVKGNETAYQISQNFKVPIDSIKKWNYLDKNYKVIEGMKLRIRRLPITLPDKTKDSQNIDSDSDQIIKDDVKTHFHIVAKSEDLFRISLLYQVPIDSIRKWNNLGLSNPIIIGQQLRISGRKRDTLIAAKTIAEKGTPVNSLVQKTDTSVISGNPVPTVSSLNGTQTKSVPYYSDTVEKDTGSTFMEIMKYYYHNSNYLFHFVLFLNLFFLISSLLMAFGLIFRRIEKGYIESIKRKCRDRYRDFITDWLYEEHIRDVPEYLIKELKNPIQREVFTSELLSLHNNLIGESADRLTELYKLAGFEKYSIKKIKRPFWHLKAKGFRELAQMKVKENAMIYKYLNSGNLTLSIEAQLAWIQLNPDDPLSFYDDPNVKLTEWGQLNLLIALRKSGRTPDFSRWLTSTSKSVSLFALKMEGIYKEFENVELVVQRLDDRDKEIRREAICTLGKMALHAPGYKLQRLFPNEELENKTEIIRALTMMSESSNTPFFESVLLGEDDINLRILSAKGMVSEGDYGRERLDSIFSGADPKLKKIINHAKDNRI